MVDSQWQGRTVVIVVAELLVFEGITRGVHHVAKWCLALLVDDGRLNPGHDGLDLVGVLDADDLIHSIPEPGELLALVMKFVLVHAELHV